MIITIFGEDTFRSRKFLKEQVEEFKKRRDPTGLNIVFVDGKSETMENILKEATSSPFLAERKMIVIKNILSTKDEEKIDRIKEVIENKIFPEINVVVFFQEEEIGKSKKIGELFVLLKKEKFVYETNLMPENDLRIWAEKEIKSRNGKIKISTLNILLKAAQNDSWFLNSLIDQLISFKNGEEIQIEDINLFAEEKIDDNIFALAEAVVYGDKNKALKMINEQRKNGAEDGYLFSMILRQFKILAQAKDVLERNNFFSAEEVAKEIKQKPFVIKKVWSLLQKDFSWFVRAYDLMLDLDLKFKTGVADQDVLLDLLVEKI